MDENVKNDILQPKPKKTKNRKFNFVDAAIILIVIVAIALVIMFFSPGDLGIFNDDSMTTVEYVICFSEVPEEIINNIKLSNEAVDGSSKYDLGKVTYIENTEKSYAYVVDPATGQIVKQLTSGYNVYVTLRSKAKKTEDVGYSVNSCRIAVGKQFDIRFPNFSGNGYCISINEYVEE